MIYLKSPKIDELHYRQEWMKDPKTMNYNVGYDMDLKGYDKETGTITKTDDERITWYNNWVNKEPDKYFAYIYDEKILVEIENLYHYPSFEELYKNFDKVEMGYDEENIADPKDMEEYYSPEEQSKYGVLGIKNKKM